MFYSQVALSLLPLSPDKGWIYHLPDRKVLYFLMASGGKKAEA